MTPAQRHRERYTAQVTAAGVEALAAETERAEKARTPRPPQFAQTLAPNRERKDRLSPAQRHLLKATTPAAIVGETAPDRNLDGPAASAYDLLRAQLGEHMARLKDIKSIERKIEAKKTMLADYDDHVVAVLATAEETSRASQDEVFVELMIWRLDVGDFDLGLQMAEHVLKYGLTLPERYNRTPATLIGDLVADAAIAAKALDLDFDIDVLNRAVALTEGHDVNDIVRAKLQKGLGQQYLRRAQNTEPTADGPAGAKRAAAEAGVEHFTRAIQLHDKVGVKQDLDTLKRIVAKSDA
ncbi:terminase, endonuclease subunit [Asticcacaulis biprosthecium C19]|uniref:Terminase, endonuclease subunit n=1 Tax=Asticcacaulis biprosthecium C19 TaxID=715226 RepID=F4QJD2_9CAUL|nr:phage terminase small subunit [Asticcacaulis biprosthecium]EGF93115.1 terminase, endonuclease subunit [Asticcacaulis biprosthecium C19]